MATLNRTMTFALAALAAGSASWWVAGCDKLVGLSTPDTPLVRFRVQVSGDIAPLVPSWAADPKPRLRAALVWGAQWQPQPLCALPPASPEAEKVLAAGCPDNFGFVPARVAADAKVTARGTAALELTSAPAADVMVGEVTARVAYASVYIYDDRNGNDTLDFGGRLFFQEGEDPGENGGEHDNPMPNLDAGPSPDKDLVYGASFISMTMPDQRVAFREGKFPEKIAFYPRAGCPAPPRGFSVLSTGGFSAADGTDAALKGQLPAEEPADCAAASPASSIIRVELQSPEQIKQLACQPFDAEIRYHAPPADTPDLAAYVWACAPLPVLPGDDAGTAAVDVTQLIITGSPNAECRRITHLVLKGCEHDPLCASPDWDLSSQPPSWWPCPVSP
jgi:hypothetical protein